MISAAGLRACLADGWRLAGAAIEAHHGGMNSATWSVSLEGRRWVAKAVAPGARRSFAGGLAVAAALEAGGIPAGAPVPDRHGRVVTDVDGVPLALLTWVPGVELSGGDRHEQRLIGATLARVHRTLRGAPVTAGYPFHWVDPAAAHLGVRPWVREAVAGGVAALDRLDARTLSTGLLHMDPAPKAFRWDPATGICGVIDWSVAMTGPLLYDLASAVMYIGGPDHAGPLLDAYLDHQVLPRAEVDRGLLAMLRFRWAVQADYFARRTVAGDLTGITDATGNEAGLERARRGLDLLGGASGF